MPFLKRLKRPVPNSISPRADSSNTHYQQAMAQLEQAHLEQFSQPHRLKEVTALFLQAIRANHADPNPLLGMSYLLLLLENPMQAEQYLQAALRLAPTHPTALGLQAQLREQLAVVRPAHHALEQIALTLQTEIRQLSQQPPPTIETEPEALRNLYASTRQLQVLYANSQRELNRAGHESETLGLHQALRPLEIRLKQFERVLRHSQQTLDLRNRMAQERESTLCLCQYLCYQSQEQAFVQLESILDACDQIALEINGLEEQDCDIRVLETDYQQLSQAVTLFQETLDEMTGQTNTPTGAPHAN